MKATTKYAIYAVVAWLVYRKMRTDKQMSPIRSTDVNTENTGWAK